MHNYGSQNFGLHFAHISSHTVWLLSMQHVQLANGIRELVTTLNPSHQ